jgi:glycosyltransferase involved in cell wall biosynthesis
MINPSQPDYSNTPICGERPSFSYNRASLEATRSPNVSIVTSLPGESEFFQETAASLLGQSLQDWEWIIATDSIDQCAIPDQRVRMAPGWHHGTRPFQQAAQLACAPLILFLECGDLLEPTALEKLCWFLAAHPEYAFARGYCVGFGALHGLLREHEGYCKLVMFRRAALLQLEDMHRDFWLQCAERGYCGGTIPEFLSWRRLNADENARQSVERLPSRSNIWKNTMPAAKFGSSLAPDAGPPSNQLAKATGRRRLLLLAPHLEIGGADKFNLDLIGCLQRDHNYEVSVITTHAGGDRWRHYFERLTPDVFTLHTFLPREDYSRFLSYFIESRKPDTVLIANSRIAYQLLPFLRSANRPSFVDYLHMEDWSAQGYPRLSLNCAPFLDGTIVSSGHLKKRLVEAGGVPDRIHIATTNIDPQLWDASRYDAPGLRTKYGVPEGVPVIAFIARLCRQKQPGVMASVLKTLRDRGLKFVCIVAGDGDYRRGLENFIKKHHLTQMQLLGAVSSEQVREILAMSDVFFLPSEDEGIALSLFEAMSMGVPPVAAGVGGQSELVSPDCGILIKPGPSQVKEYADALQRLLTGPELRSSMGSRSRERIRHRFTLDEMGDRMAKLLESAATNNSFDPAAARQNWSGFADAAQAQGSHAILAGLVSTALLLLSPRQFGLKLRNLSLLGRVLLNRGKRSQLAGTFDARYYLSHHPDLRALGVAPLLHYALQGYREDRQPGPHFDSAECCRRYPGISVNPMLWNIVRGRE